MSVATCALATPPFPAADSEMITTAWASPKACRGKRVEGGGWGGAWVRGERGAFLSLTQFS